MALMPLAGSLAALAGAALLGLAAAALGAQFLRLFRIPSSGGAERLLFSAASGFVLLEAAFFFAQFGGHLPLSFAIILVLAAALGATQFPGVLRALAKFAGRAWHDSLANRGLACATIFVLLIEALAAMAPMTGSDALHYHFAAPAAELRNGFAPDFFLSHSFLLGQGHLLILLGLAFHSEKLALALLFLGGVLAAAAAACLVRAWAPQQYAWLTALAFLLSPVVFWQLSTSGSPDLWMGFFSAVAVLAIGKVRDTPRPGLAAFCGMCAGITAGTKYTGCIVAASLLLAFLWESRSLRLALIFVGTSLAAGIWPYARNFVWTGDPVFPFALQWFHKTPVNARALAAVLADTGVTARLGLSQILQFPLLSAIDPKHLGFWQFFGPLCLLFAPMFLFLVPRHSAARVSCDAAQDAQRKAVSRALWRTLLLVWFVTAIGVAVSSGMLRFLVTVFPLALAAAFAGCHALCARASRPLRWIAAASVGLTLAMGFAGMLVYLRPALAAGVGFVSRERYLQQHAQEYAICEFIDSAISAQAAATGDARGKTLVFLRHLYLLRVPYVYGDPEGSWAVDADHLLAPADWQAFFRRNGIRWIARTGDYPASIAEPLRALEAQGALLPVAQGQVNDLHGMRILDDRRSVPVAILQVQQ